LNINKNYFVSKTVPTHESYRFNDDPPYNRKSILEIILDKKKLNSSKKSNLVTNSQRQILGGKLADKIRKLPSINHSKEGIEDEKCLVCAEGKPDGIFMHCGHGGVCTSCAFEMVTIKLECHLCRMEIKQVVQ